MLYEVITEATGDAALGIDERVIHVEAEEVDLTAEEGGALGGVDVAYRIPSYNVCYTKLLRKRRRRASPPC